MCLSDVQVTLGVVLASSSGSGFLKTCVQSHEDSSEFAYSASHRVTHSFMGIFLPVYKLYMCLGFHFIQFWGFSQDTEV